jgi:hypothetical protein
MQKNGVEGYPSASPSLACSCILLASPFLKHGKICTGLRTLGNIFIEKKIDKRLLQ